MASAEAAVGAHPPIIGAEPQLRQAALQFTELPARLYCLLSGDHDQQQVEVEVARLVAQATAAQLCAPSAWAERSWCPAAPAADGSPSPQRQYLRHAVPVASQADACFATYGLSAIHVLAQRCTNAAVVRAAVCKAGTGVLAQRGDQHPDKCQTVGWTHAAGRTAMHCGAYMNPSVEVIHMLVELGGVEQLRVTDGRGCVPMHWAARHNTSVEVIYLLVKLGGVEQLLLADKDGQVPVHLAARFNPSVDILQAVVKLGGLEQLQKVTRFGSLPLHLAARNNPSVEVVRALMELGGVEQLQVPDSTTWCRLPVHCAAFNPSVEVLRVLVKLGGLEQLWAADETGKLPIHWATCRNTSVEKVRTLVEMGGIEQLRAADDDGLSPLHLAARYNSGVQVVEYLLGIGCERNARTRDGHTPLQLAIDHNDKTQVSTMLVEAGADTAHLLLSPSLLHTASSVSVTTVLSSYYCAERRPITALEAAVRCPCCQPRATLPLRTHSKVHT
jgi:ankyrin repeat protein